MCEYENNGCRDLRDDGCRRDRDRDRGCGCGCGLTNMFGTDTLLIIAIIILFVLLFCDTCD